MVQNEPKAAPDVLDPTLPVALLLVGGENQVGGALLHLFRNHQGSEFSQVLLVSIGVMDHTVMDVGADPAKGFEGTQEAGRLAEKTRRELTPYIDAAHELGMKAAVHVSISTDPVRQVGDIAAGLFRTYPKGIFFVGRMLFQKRRWFHRLLHAGTSRAMQDILERQDLPVRVLPLILPN